jgi:hypothetical protein
MHETYDRDILKLVEPTRGRREADMSTNGHTSANPILRF